MNESSSSFSADNYFLQSSQDDNSLVGMGLPSIPRRERDEECRAEQLNIDFQLLKKHPALFCQYAKILGKRANYPELKNACIRFQQYRRQHEIDGLMLKSQLSQKEELILKELSEITIKRQNIRQEINKLQQKSQKQTAQRNQLTIKNYGLRAELKRLRELVYELTQFKYENDIFKDITKSDDKTYRDILSELRRKVQEQKVKGSQSLSQSNEDLNAQQRDIAQMNMERITKREKQIKQIKKQIEQTKQISEIQNNKIKEISQKIKEFKRKRGHPIDESQMQNGKLSLRKNIQGSLIEKYIEDLDKEKQYQKWIRKPLQQYMQTIDQLQERVKVVQAELQFHNRIKSQKASKCALLEKRLEDVLKQKNQLTKSINSQVETQQGKQNLQTSQIGHEELLLRTYDFQQKKAISQRLSQECKIKQEPFNVDSISEIKSRSVNHNMIRVQKQPKSYKRAINWILLGWLIILSFVFTHKLLVKHDLWPTQIFEQPKTIIHRYQGKHRVVDGKLVNITENLVLNEVQDNESLPLIKDEDYQLQRKPVQQVIVVEPKPTQPTRQTGKWSEMLKLEYS